MDHHRMAVAAKSGVRLSIVALLLTMFATFLFAQEPDEIPMTEVGLKAVETIRAEVMKLQGDKDGNPLPLAATWAPLGHNFSPDYQLGLIRQGHHLILCFGFPYADTQWGGENAHLPRYQQMRLDNFKKNFEPALREAARLKLPLSFQRFQFEMELTSEKKYFDLPPAQNPNVIGLDGKVQRMVDPMGPIELWRQLGKEQVTSMCWRLAQEIYPDPPFVILLSNNEHPVLSFHDAEKSKRFVDRYGTGTTTAFRRQLFAEENIKRYRELQEGMLEGLINDNWRKNARFFAYEAFGPSHLGRYGGWHGTDTFDVEAGRITWPHLAWDGSSPSYYTHNWLGVLTDYTSCSMQTEAMNWVFMLKDVFQENPTFWFELSTWDGDTGSFGGKRYQYAVRGGQIFDADRYQGMLQFGLWLTRARALRDFRYQESLAYAEPYFLANVKAVDQVHASPLLQRFWRHGELVPNNERKHPYQAALTDGVKDKERWYLLKTNLESPAQNWGLYTEIPVFSLALVLGQEPHREWLVYTHAPRGARTGVHLTLPEYGELTVDASVTGSFYHVLEEEREETCIIPGGPISALPVVSKSWVEVNEEVVFSATDVFSGGTGELTLRWDFGDGAQDNGDTIAHAYQKPGFYVASLTVTNPDGDSHVRNLPVTVGKAKLDNCLLYLPLDKSPEVGVATEKVTGGGYEREAGLLKLVYAANTTQFCALNSGGDWVEDPERGSVLHLPGELSYVAVEECYSADYNKQIPRYDALGLNRTTSLWFKATDNQSRQMIYQDGSANADGMNIYLDKGRLYAGAYSTTLKDWPGTWLSTTIDTDNWHHVALVLDSAAQNAITGTLKLFVDGKKVAEGEAPYLRPYWARLGGNWSTRYHDGEVINKSIAFKGVLDDFTVFLKPLNDEEVLNLKESQQP